MLSKPGSTIGVPESVFISYSSECLESLKSLAADALLSPTTVEEFEGGEGRLVLEEGRLRPQRVRAGGQSPVVACDASIVRVAECPNGVVLALRGAVVHRDRGLGVEVIGPLIRFVGYEAAGSPDAAIREELRSFERLVQLYAASRHRGSLILLDSSLTITPDRAGQLLLEVLAIAEGNGNTVLAFSKESSLLVAGSSLKSIQAEAEPPLVIDITRLVRYSSPGYRIAGRVLLARLSPCLFPFRLDSYPPSTCIEGISSLLSSDALIYGYPETLSLAHGICTFTWLDVVCLQRALVKETGAALITQPQVRPAVLGPFEKHES